MAKGQQYERVVCRQLSRWVSRGLRDDLFWRSSQSGGRATVRARKGQTTQGHCGDISPTCREGEVLTSKFTIEVKCGYSALSPADLLDTAGRKFAKKTPAFLKFIIQSRVAANRAGTPGWLLIHKRNGRPAMAYMQWCDFAVLFKTFPEHAYIRFRHDEDWEVVGCCRLDDLTERADPRRLKDV